MKSKKENNFFKENKSFTLVELLVVMGIILILSGISLINYQSGEKYFALQRSAQKIAEDLNYAQNLAMNSKEFNGTIPKGGYGVYFDLSFENYYKLYADLDNNQKYSSQGEDVLGNIKLETDVFIKALSSSSGLSINFKPPDPIVKIITKEGNELKNVAITLCIKDTDCNKSSNIKNVVISQTGLIEVK